jgi:predicted AAA+ superfamily ATPase
LALSDPRYRSATLSTYVETYLRQELLQEGLLRKIEPFSRFLQVAGILNGQVLNVLNVSRDAHVGRSTVEKYFEVLEDTLIGARLPAYQPGIKIKETTHPKFYFFDSGVARACAGLLEEEVDSFWRGFALETYLLHELRAYNHYRQRNRPIHYYSVLGGGEIDFVIETKRKTPSQSPEVVCIEVKHARRWDRRWCEPCLDFGAERKIKVKARFGVYLGSEEQAVHGMRILPLPVFLEKLWEGEVF